MEAGIQYPVRLLPIRALDLVLLLTAEAMRTCGQQYTLLCLKKKSGHAVQGGISDGRFQPHDAIDVCRRKQKLQGVKSKELANRSMESRFGKSQATEKPPAPWPLGLVCHPACNNLEACKPSRCTRPLFDFLFRTTYTKCDTNCGGSRATLHFSTVFPSLLVVATWKFKLRGTTLSNSD
ncbi:hypothetical protein B0T17DRAFT_156409 [Bombardia bombarda]|uniref:Secreted protein n=1 Tax=Bombardia bombarda TaxID=252184 RepID=A0AA40C7L6_9PEZI|nr:hypothetical protein B0T17DRAFT_156409 [Bombardia bombarda]